MKDRKAYIVKPKTFLQSEIKNTLDYKSIASST